MTMTYAEAIRLLCELTGWDRPEVERADPTDVLWKAMEKVVDARDVVAEAQQAVRR